MDKKKNNWLFPILSALLVLVASVAYLAYKVAEKDAYNEKWKDYDDCGWS